MMRFLLLIFFVVAQPLGASDLGAASAGESARDGLQDCSKLLLFHEQNPVEVPEQVYRYRSGSTPLILLTKDAAFPEARISTPASLLEFVKNGFGPDWRKMEHARGDYYLSDNVEAAVIFIPNAALSDNGDTLRGLIQYPEDIKNLYVVVTDARADLGSLHPTIERSGASSGNLAVKSVQKALIQSLFVPFIRDALANRPSVPSEYMATDRLLQKFIDDLGAKESEAYSFSFVRRRISRALGKEIEKLAEDQKDTEDLSPFIAMNGLTENVLKPAQAFLPQLYRYHTISVGLGFKNGRITRFVQSPNGVDHKSTGLKLAATIRGRSQEMAHIESTLKILRTIEYKVSQKKEIESDVAEACGHIDWLGSFDVVPLDVALHLKHCICNNDFNKLDARALAALSETLRKERN